MKNLFTALVALSLVTPLATPAFADDECDFSCEAGRTVNDGADNMAEDKSWLEEKIINWTTDQNREENPELESDDSEGDD